MDEYELCTVMAELCGMELYLDGFDQPRIKVNERMSCDGHGTQYELMSVSAMDFFFCRKRKTPTPPGFFYVVEAVIKNHIGVQINLERVPPEFTNPKQCKVNVVAHSKSLPFVRSAYNLFTPFYESVALAYNERKELLLKA